jgi:hypothetical protein
MSITTCTSPKCPHESYAPCVEPTVSYEGAVLAKFERNGYDDSDFVAIVWDAENKALRHITYASTRGWTYHNGASVDATPAVLVDAALHLAELIEARMLAAKATRLHDPLVTGRVVRSTTTRGKNVGVTGTVAWIGPNRYAYGATGAAALRVGVKVVGEERLRYLDGDRVALVDTPAVVELTPEEKGEAVRMAHHRAVTGQWRQA